jgi:hypothetical protein
MTWVRGQACGTFLRQAADAGQRDRLLALAGDKRFWLA